MLFILAFSVGLASVLAGVAILFTRTRSAPQDPARRLLPILATGIIGIVGIAFALRYLGTANLFTASFSLTGRALAVFGLGLFLGLKHATDADHVVAVTTFVSQERSVLKSCWIGAFWGIGHTLSLAVAGLIVIGFRINISEWLSARLEFGVAVMLVALGARVLFRTLDGEIESHRHEHGYGSRLKPLLVGIVHGAAGSAALMLLVLSTIRSPLEAVAFILIFGFGSILGMLMISFFLAVPMQWAHGKAGMSYKPIQVTAGIFSCLFGLVLGAEIWMSMP